MNSQRKIGAILSYINIVIKNLVNFIYTPVLLHYVGQSQYGLFQMTNSVISSLSILAMGLSSAYVKFYFQYKVKEDEENIRKLNGLYLMVFIFVSILAMILGTVLANNTDSLFSSGLSKTEIDTTKQLMYIMTFNLALTFPSSVFDSNIMVNEQFKFQQFRQLLQSLLVPIFAIPMVSMGYGILSIGIIQILVTLLFLILNVNYCYKKLMMRFDFRNIAFYMLKPLLIFSSYILLNQIVDMVNNNAPSFILGMILGAKQVAIFAIAIQIKNMFFMLSTSLSSVFVPKINEMVNRENSKETLLKLMVKVGRIQMNILFFVLGGFILLGQYFIQLWAGSENLEAYSLIILMVLPSIIPLSQNLGIEIQRAMNMHKFRSISYTIFAGINLVVTYFGTMYFGLKGATMGYIISILVANGVLMNWYYHVKMQLNMNYYWKNTIVVVVPFLLVTSLLMLVSKLLPINSIFLFLIYGLIYMALYFVVFYTIIANNFEKEQLKKIK